MFGGFISDGVCVWGVLSSCPWRTQAEEQQIMKIRQLNVCESRGRPMCESSRRCFSPFRPRLPHHTAELAPLVRRLDPVV